MTGPDPTTAPLTDAELSNVSPKSPERTVEAAAEVEKRVVAKLLEQAYTPQT